MRVNDLKLNNNISHRLSNIIYSYQSVVLLLFLFTLITAWQASKLLFMLSTCILFTLTLMIQKLLNDKMLKLKNLFILAFILTLLAQLFTPSSLPNLNLNESILISGEVYNVRGKNADIKANVVNKNSIFPAARIRIKFEEIKVGDRVVLETRLALPNEATNPGQFNYRDYLNSKGIYYIGENPKIIKQTPNFSLKGYIDSIRERLILPAQETLSEDVFSIFSAMILGEKSELDSDIYGYYQGSGISHVLVISGMHLGLLVSFLMYLLHALKLNKRVSTTIILAFIWGYALLTGFSISVVRAAIMLSIFLVSKDFYQVHKPLNTLAIVAVLMITLSPLTVQRISWQLSFAATAGILILLPLINKYFGNSTFVNSLGVIVAVQIATLPIIASNFNFLSLYALPANLIIVPLTYITLILGVFFLIPMLGKLLCYPMALLLNLNLNIAKFFSSLPFSKLSLKHWSLTFAMIYLVALLLFILLIKREKLKLTLYLAIAILCCGLLNSSISKDYLEITFLDVEQGDSAVLRWPNGYTMVIDGGERNEYKDYGSTVLLPFLRQAGVNKVNALVISHSDNDHIGGLLSIINEVSIDRVYLSPQAYYLGSEKAIEMVEKSRVNGTAIEQITENDMINIMPNSFIEAFGPANNIKESDSNNNSLVLRVCYGGTSVLFTGDIEQETEQRIAQKYKSLLQSDIIKVPHHGSNTSSTQDFIEYVQPQFAVFSAGRNNRFGHPHQDIISRYEQLQIKMYRTDKDGAVMLRTDGNEINIECYYKQK